MNYIERHNYGPCSVQSAPQQMNVRPQRQILPRPVPIGASQIPDQRAFAVACYSTATALATARIYLNNNDLSLNSTSSVAL
jgi:hypothetical protein